MKRLGLNFVKKLEILFFALLIMSFFIMLPLIVVKADDQSKHDIYIDKDVYSCITVLDSSGNKKEAIRKEDNWEVMQAYTGEILTLKQQIGYLVEEIENLYIYDMNDIFVKNFNFIKSPEYNYTMPDFDIKMIGSLVGVEFKLEAEVKPKDAGKVINLPDSAKVGDKVTFKVVPNKDLKVISVDIYLQNESIEGYSPIQSLQPNSENNYTFDMQRGNVKVSVTFESDTNVSEEGTMESEVTDNSEDDKSDSISSTNKSSRNISMASTADIAKTGDNNIFWIWLSGLCMVLSLVILVRLMRCGREK